MNYTNPYAQFLKKFLRPRREMRVVLDASDGCTGPILKKLFSREHRVRAVLLHTKPDGDFPAHGPNPRADGATAALDRAVRRNHADFGAIFDADGDRVLFVDDAGKDIPAEAVTAILGWNVRGPIMVDILFGKLLHDLLPHKVFVRSRVGRTFIKAALRRRNLAFAAERSGHYYFKDFFGSDSGIFAAVQFLNLVSARKGSLHRWIQTLPRYAQSGELNFRVKNKKAALAAVAAAFKNSARRISFLDGITMEFGEGSWFNLRPSNTEDVVRLNVETRNHEGLKRLVQKIKTVLKPAKSRGGQATL